MGTRRSARERALQLLYQVDITHGSLEQAAALYWEEHADESEDVRRYAMNLARGVQRRQVKIDALIEKYSTNWKLRRMPTIDRNILRIAVYEFLDRRDVPAAVSIDEAIELGKAWSTEDSGSFINGILDRIARSIGKPKGRQKR